MLELTREELRGAGTDDYGRLSPRDSKGLDIRVSPGQLTRARRLAEGLIRGLASLGYTVELRNRWNQKFETCGLIDGEAVRFSIWEPSRRSVRTSDGSRWSYDRYVYTPTGDLELRIDEYVPIGTAKTIRDRPSGKVVEDALGRFVVSMHAVAQVMKSERLEREREDERRRAALRDRERHEREFAYEGWLVRDLVQKAESRREATLIRSFLDEVGSDESVMQNPQTAEWIAWAHGIADKMDPLRNGRVPSEPLHVPESWKESRESDRSSRSPAGALLDVRRAAAD